MTQTKAISTAALVCRSVDYGEADRVLTLLTLEAGKVSVLARGARRSRRRFGAALDLFVLGHAALRLRTDGRLSTLERFDRGADYGAAIVRDVVKVAHGSYMLELARELWPPEQREPALFALLVEGLAVLAAQAPSAGLLRSFELQLLRSVGLVPALERCVRCDDAVEGKRLSLAVGEGGVVCGACGPAASPLSTACWEGLLALRDAPLAQAAGRVPPGLQRELRELMLLVVQHHLGRRPKALDFILALTEAAAPRSPVAAGAVTDACAAADAPPEQTPTPLR